VAEGICSECKNQLVQISCWYNHSETPQRREHFCLPSCDAIAHPQGIKTEIKGRCARRLDFEL